MENVLRFQPLCSILFWPMFYFLFSGMANSADPNQTAQSGLVSTVCICHFVRRFVV